MMYSCLNCLDSMAGRLRSKLDVCRKRAWSKGTCPAQHEVQEQQAEYCHVGVQMTSSSVDMCWLPSMLQVAQDTAGFRLETSVR